ncbi:MAG: type II secretion system major pseudopilin GspG [Desulfobaccales bacterium]
MAQRQRRREAGFTLIELMVVLFILALLAALVGPKFIGQVGKAKPKAAAVQIQMLANALDLFYLDVGRYPTTEEGLQALVKNPGTIAQWAGPYLDKGVPKDPWGRDYVYRFPGTHGNAYDLYSLGADGAEGGEGENRDITNWQSDSP